MLFTLFKELFFPEKSVFIRSIRVIRVPVRLRSNHPVDREAIPLP